MIIIVCQLYDFIVKRPYIYSQTVVVNWMWLWFLSYLMSIDKCFKV